MGLLSEATGQLWGSWWQEPRLWEAAPLWMWAQIASVDWPGFSVLGHEWRLPKLPQGCHSQGWPKNRNFFCIK